MFSFVVVVQVGLLGVFHCGGGDEPGGAGWPVCVELGGDDVDVDAVEEVVFGAEKKVRGSVPRAVDLGEGFRALGEWVVGLLRRLGGSGGDLSVRRNRIRRNVLLCVTRHWYIAGVDVGVMRQSLWHLG